MDIDLILAGEFNPYPSQAAKEERAKYVVKRMATVRGQAAISQEMALCKNVAAFWHWGDNSTTVVDIRPKAQEPVFSGQGEGV